MVWVSKGLAGFFLRDSLGICNSYGKWLLKGSIKKVFVGLLFMSLNRCYPFACHSESFNSGTLHG